MRQLSLTVRPYLNCLLILCCCRELKAAGQSFLLTLLVSPSKMLSSCVAINNNFSNLKLSDLGKIYNRRSKFLWESMVIFESVIFPAYRRRYFGRRLLFLACPAWRRLILRGRRIYTTRRRLNLARRYLFQVWMRLLLETFSDFSHQYTFKMIHTSLIYLKCGAMEPLLGSSIIDFSQLHALN